MPVPSASLSATGAIVSAAAELPLRVVSWALVLSIATAAGSAAVPEGALPSRDGLSKAPPPPPPTYVGSDTCITPCHLDKGSQRKTRHATSLRRPLVVNSLRPGRGVIADFDLNGVDDFLQGLDFNTISSAFDAYKPHAPILSVEGGVYFVRIGELKSPVTFTVGGHEDGTAQSFAVRIPVTDLPSEFSRSNYLAPLRFVPGVGWLTLDAQSWYDASSNPRWDSGVTSSDLAAHGGNFTPSCVGCHVTGIKSVGPGPTGEIRFDGFHPLAYGAKDPAVFDYDDDGKMETVNVGCESCHGAGSNHAVTDPGNPSYIVNPDDLPSSAQTEICGRCHVRAHSVPDGKYDWPYEDDQGIDWTPHSAAAVVPLSTFMTDADVRWPDGVHGRLTRRYQEFVESVKSSSAMGPVTCADCHDPHQEFRTYSIRSSLQVDGITIATRVEDNSLCLACHAGSAPFVPLAPQNIASKGEPEVAALIAEVTSLHTKHSYAPDRLLGESRCVRCHMPTMSGRGTLTEPSHVFGVVGPEATLAHQDEGGMPNSCAVSCHGFRVDVFDVGIDPNPDNSVWNELFDRTLATLLLSYFGSGGAWWDTTPPPNGEPTVVILEPWSGAVRLAGEVVEASATASDLEDGDLTPVISWASSLDGSLGHGGSLSTVGLSVGSHRITAWAMDSNGVIAADRILVHVIDPVDFIFSDGFESGDPSAWSGP